MSTVSMKARAAGAAALLLLAGAALGIALDRTLLTPASAEATALTVESLAERLARVAHTTRRAAGKATVQRLASAPWVRTHAQKPPAAASTRALRSLELLEARVGPGPRRGWRDEWIGLQLAKVRRSIAGQPYELFGEVKRGAQLVVGVVNETMPHDDGWRFLTLGRMLERIEMTCRLLSVRLVTARGAREMLGFQDGLAILRSVSASEAFRKTHRRMDPASVVDFLLLSSDFPRAVLYCLRSAEVQLSVLGEGVPGVGRSRRMLGRLRASVEYRNVDELVEEGLEAFLEDLEDGVRDVAACVDTEFIRHGQPSTLHTVATA